MEITDRLDMAMGIAEGLKASSTLSGNTIYDLCLHISKAQEQLKNHCDIGVVSDSSDADYWSARCKLSEDCEEESPCDPDITKAQIEAHKNYHNFIKDKGGKNYR